MSQNSRVSSKDKPLRIQMFKVPAHIRLSEENWSNFWKGFSVYSQYLLEILAFYHANFKNIIENNKTKLI